MTQIKSKESLEIWATDADNEVSKICTAIGPIN